jgi:2-hydroxychromene-2-carboxylate isomerase
MAAWLSSQPKGSNPAAAMRSQQQPTCYFSFRSPYSWLAHHDLTTRYSDVAATLTWRPFWEPDELSLRMLTGAGGRFPYVENSRPKARYILMDVRRLAASRGLALTWPVDRQPRWEVSHLAYLAAQRLRRGPEFIAAVYRARWQQGRDIGEPATIAAIAADLDLDPARVAGAADDPGMRAAGLAALLAIDADGVFGVPFFKHGYDKYWGVDRLAAFIDALAAGESPWPGGDSKDPGGGQMWPHRCADQGHAGGCG